ncbi:helix-turn-helix domain-containing protein [Bradyrhizobium aeschynomenes]|uniref:helix-turn-helix domain-containing protein n=1 Tax=Bradyrhizobium aeschynomenes TaxID=2734909 RepID=UPI001555C492|nr:helix-turn-helix transcriptional regulator [Bradyrhizobium aeschynomenes]NPV24508.1 helix-turn-helix transcriptional regulator [Bradyrhizobium aeschynomenes]
MQVLGQKLRSRAKELGFSNAEVARRAGLSERRYGFYVTGDREPDLSTLLRICKVLTTTPNALMGISEDGKEGSSRNALAERLRLASRALSENDLQLLVVQAEALVLHRGRSK